MRRSRAAMASSRGPSRARVACTSKGSNPRMRTPRLRTSQLHGLPLPRQRPVPDRRMRSPPQGRPADEPRQASKLPGRPGERAARLRAPPSGSVVPGGGMQREAPVMESGNRTRGPVRSQPPFRSGFHPHTSEQPRRMWPRRKRPPPRRLFRHARAKSTPISRYHAHLPARRRLPAPRNERARRPGNAHRPEAVASRPNQVLDRQRVRAVRKAPSRSEEKIALRHRKASAGSCSINSPSIRTL